MKIILCLLILVSCGKPPVDPDPSYPGLITYNVPTKFYNKYKSQLDWISSDIISMTGKHLVRFVANDSDPKYSTMYQGLTRFYSKNEAWVYFKETKEQFKDVGDNAAGMAYVGSPSRPLGVIVLNFSAGISWKRDNFRHVMNHEVLHNLGFNHTFDGDKSVMNYDYTYKGHGVTDLDRQRLASNFPFSLEAVTIKDLEKIGAVKEGIDADNYADFLVENYGLLETRAQTISKYILSYKKLANTRALTIREKDLLTNEILGFGFKRGQKALESHLQGDQNSLDDLILKAATKNETSPEHIKDLFGEIFL